MSGMTQVTRGPFGWSTSRVLARRASVVCYDVNGYYRDLGIEHPYVHATAGDIRRAFLERGGPDDPRLTMIFTTFLDPLRKAEYDAMPLGTRYLDEEERMARRWRDIAARQRGEIPDEEWEAAPATGSLDSEPELGKDGPYPAKETARTPDIYPFTILLRDTSTYNLVVLEQWQNLLIDAVQRQGGPSKIGLGVMENQGTTWIVGDALGTTAVLLDRWLRPSQVEAERIVLACQGS